MTTPTVSLTTDHLQDAAKQLRSAKMDTSALQQNQTPLGTMAQDGSISPQISQMTAQAGDTAQAPAQAAGGAGCAGGAAAGAGAAGCGAGGGAGGGGGNTKAQQAATENTANQQIAQKDQSLQQA
jgi:hypothetical protein